VEESETDWLLMLAVKNNLGAKADGIGYRLKAGTIPQDIETCRIEWDNEPVIVSANEALAEAASESKRGTQRREAEEFLTAYLSAGPMPVERFTRPVQRDLRSDAAPRPRNPEDRGGEKRLRGGLAMAPAMIMGPRRWPLKCEDGHFKRNWPSLKVATSGKLATFDGTHHGRRAAMTAAVCMRKIPAYWGTLMH
jgi:hypothetical protein